MAICQTLTSVCRLRFNSQSVNRSFFIHGYLFSEAGCADGWIHEGLVFKGQQSTEDYHGEMNSEVFEEWVSLILKYHTN